MSPRRMKSETLKQGQAESDLSLDLGHFCPLKVLDRYIYIYIHYFERERERVLKVLLVPTFWQSELDTAPLLSAHLL